MVCSVDRCEREARTKSLCLKHYKRLLRHGSPAGGGPARNCGNIKICVADGCAREAAANGMCAKHNNRNKSNGSPYIVRVNQEFHGGKHWPEYAVWNSIKQRVDNPSNRAYKNYGGRGITLASEWYSFSKFLADMGRRPGPEYT